MLLQLLSVSSLLLFTFSPALAHEVSPTIADLSLKGGQVRLDIRLTLESFLAGVDLDATEDTDTAVQASDYDALRALGPAELEARMQIFAPQFLSEVKLSIDGQNMPLRIAKLDIPDVGDVELPRISHMALIGIAPLDARSIQLAWPKGYGTLILRQMEVENAYTGYISGGQTSPAIAVSGGELRSFFSVFAEYIPVGFDHILPKGLDHILFVLGLFFFSTRLRPLFIQVTAFTLAHTVTLALGAFEFVTIPANIVEPIIAASIIYVAVENIFARELNPWRPAVIFIFGLLHGLGFASVLGEFGLPAGQFFAALIGFNVGVEFGQVTVIALAFLAVGYWFSGKIWYRARIAVPASIVIAAVGAYWFIQRVFF